MFILSLLQENHCNICRLEKITKRANQMEYHLDHMYHRLCFLCSQDFENKWKWKNHVRNQFHFGGCVTESHKLDKYAEKPQPLITCLQSHWY